MLIFYLRKNRKENIFIGGHSLSTTGFCTVIYLMGVGRDVRSTVITSSSFFFIID